MEKGDHGGIPCTSDKLIQKVGADSLSEYYENNKFLESSHGFRPNKSCHSALKSVSFGNGINFMIEGDIKEYFDTIDHQVLADLLIKEGCEQPVMDLFGKMVKAGYMEKDNYKASEMGVPQGGVISPLLSNIYLHELD